MSTICTRYLLATPPHLIGTVWRSSRKKAAPAKNEDVVDLSSKFGMSFDSDSDSSDAEFAPENEAIDSDGNKHCKETIPVPLNSCG